MGVRQAMTDRRLTHKEALLMLLSDHQPHHMRELIAAGGYRYGGRLHELRQEGWEIETVRLGVGEYAYWLVPWPAKPEPVKHQRCRVGKTAHSAKVLL